MQLFLVAYKQQSWAYAFWFIDKDAKNFLNMDWVITKYYTVLANSTPDGKVIICKNYNRIKGCSLKDCNRTINGKAFAQYVTLPV